MAVQGQEGARGAAVPVETDDAMDPRNGSLESNVKTEEEDQKVELHHAPPLHPLPTPVHHHEGGVGAQHTVLDSECVERLLVVIKTEPEDISASVRRGGDQDVPHRQPAPDHLSDVPSFVVIKTEPDLQRLKCESDSGNHYIPHHEEPYLPVLCKTEPDTVDVSCPLYSGVEERAHVKMWSVQHVDCKEMPELMGIHEHSITSDTSGSSAANGNRLAGQQIPDKRINMEAKRGKRAGHLDALSKERSRLKSYFCSECGNAFSKSSALYSHMRIHTGKRVYQCSQCDKSFTQSRSFKIHQRTHTGEKPYQCTQCGKTFTRTDVLQIHQRTHTGEKPYLCSQCGKSFTRLDVYQNHCRIHTGEKPYQCSQCAKAFTRLDVYQNHQRIHTGEKPYQCSVCGRRFLYLSNIRNHERTHTEERPYRCSLCDKTFIQQNRRIQEEQGWESVIT
ncbi:hypothetical protein NFI96_020594 [Prochilodus magdalenae]|nr:hypothetical protein NFI96_020594 [Prochilodus magdalenae]